VASSTINRNVIVNGRRTSIRLELAEWDALIEICQLEDLTTNQLCQKVVSQRVEKAFTSSLRVFMLNYYRAKAGSAANPRRKRK